MPIFLYFLVHNFPKNQYFQMKPNFSTKFSFFDFKNLKTRTRASIFDLEKNWNMFWNQGSQLLLLPHETEFFQQNFIFSTTLVYICTNNNFFKVDIFLFVYFDRFGDFLELFFVFIYLLSTLTAHAQSLHINIKANFYCACSKALISNLSLTWA